MAAPARRGVAAVRADAEIVCFLDGDGSDVPAFLAAVVGAGRARRGGLRHGLAPARQARARQHDAAAARRRTSRRRADAPRLRRALHRHVAVPRHARGATARARHDARPTYGWNLEMQMRAAAAGLRIREIPVDHRCRRGGVSKVSGNLAAGLSAAWKITTTFLRLAMTLTALAREARRDRQEREQQEQRHQDQRRPERNSRRSSASGCRAPRRSRRP